MGAETTVPFSYHEDVDKLLVSFDGSKTLIALEQTPDSTPLPQFDTADAGHVVLLLGEEVSGIESSLLRKCHATIEIPMYGQKESFNVAVAAAVALYSLRERPHMIQS